MAGNLVTLAGRQPSPARGLPPAVVARLPAAVAAALVVGPFAPEYPSGADLALPLVMITLPATLARADVSAALDVANRACVPAGPSAALLATARLRVGTRQRPMAREDETLQLALYGEKLARYPADAVAAACEAWLEASPFWPSVSEILQACERAMQPRRELVLALTLKLREMGDA